MKRLILILLALPTISAAQQPPGFDPAKMMQQMNNPAAMQRMAEKAQEMHTCMADVDQARLEALGREAQTISDEIESLCKAGKKDAALKKAMAMGKKMSADPTLKKVRECSKGMAEMMKDMPFAQIPDYDENDKPTEDDICS